MSNKDISMNLDQRTVVIRRIAYEAKTLDVSSLSPMVNFLLYNNVLEQAQVDLIRRQTSNYQFQMDNMHKIKRIIKGIPFVGDVAVKTYRYFHK